MVSQGRIESTADHLGRAVAQRVPVDAKFDTADVGTRIGHHRRLHVKALPGHEAGDDRVRLATPKALTRRREPNNLGSREHRQRERRQREKGP